MRLWVIAREAAWQALQQGKRLHNDRGRRAEYAWLCEQMRRRVPGYTGPSIWWAWYILDGRGKVEPDARQRDLLHACAPGTAMVCLAVDVPEREVLLADNTLWTHVCTRGDYLAFDAPEDAAFQSLYPAPGPDAVEAILSSWGRVFTPGTWAQFDPVWLGGDARSGRNIHATFEELREADVAGVTAFTSRQPGLRLPG